MRFDHGEFSPEQDEPGDLEDIVELWFISEIEMPTDHLPEYVPMDDYLEKELARQEQEKLAEMLPDRIP